MKELIIALRREFDVVIFDTPPVLPVTDAILLSHHCDAAVIVASAAETDWQSIDRTIESLEAVNAPIIGVVLNRFDPNSAYGYYGQSYGHGYYDYYGESRSETPIKKLKV
jgi:Mrp family chromosome partitioning ATPase